MTGEGRAAAFAAPVSREAALFLGAFFDELVAWGVRRVVVSPGSRSTPLAMVAYELHRRHPELLHLYLDVDERGAAFMALGMAKAEGVPSCAICTSGTAAGNYFPAVLEAESSRVPLILLTADRPPRLQGLGVPQTMDQLELYGAHVRAFRAMPLPAADATSIAFARQAAREAVIASGAEACRCGVAAGGAAGDLRGAAFPIAGYCDGGPVQLNFPFDDPLKPDLSVAGLFEAGRAEGVAGPRVLGCGDGIDVGTADAVRRALDGRRALVLAGEGTCRTEGEAREVLAWARSLDLPVLADPLSGMRCADEPLLIDNYDSIFGGRDDVLPEAVIRFGRWPVSKRATVALAGARPFQIVVDAFETRDCNAATDLFVRATPLALVRATGAPDGDRVPREAQRAFARRWIELNDEARPRLDAPGERAADGSALPFEGAVVSRILGAVPADTGLFLANSMSVRAADTFLMRGGPRRCLLANRGLNGIDGTLSTAVGAAAVLGQATLITGDLTMLHDANALALSRELAGRCGDVPAPSLVIVLLNNDGGGIFDMLPQRSDEDYFGRLFLTPQGIDFGSLAAAFGVAYRCTASPDEAVRAYREVLGRPGISVVEIRVPLRGIRERYEPYWRI